MANVQTLEEALAEIGTAKISKTPIEKISKTPLKRKNANEVREVNTPLTNNAKIANDAKSTLNFYINKIPDIKIINTQIEIIKKEIINYTKNSSQENLDKSKIMLSDLTEKRNAINRIFSRKGFSQADENKRVEIANKIKNSPELKALREKQKELETKLKNITPNSIMANLSRIKKQIKLIEGINDNKIINLDDYIGLEDDVNLSILEQEYYDYLLFIGNIVGKKNSELKFMKASEIHTLLKINLADNKQLKEEILKVKMEISHEKNKLSETLTVTEIIHNIFDFKNDTTEGKIPKDILASTHVGLVNSIAYRVATNQGKLHELNDAVCGGMLGLTVAINKWYKMQVLSDNPLSFKDFANLHIANYAKRALYELSITGTTASSKATMDTQEKQKFDNFVKYNPQFADMDKNVIIDMLDNIDSGNKGIKTITETDYNAMVGGEDESVDMWSINNFDSNDYDPVEAKENYTRLIKSIGQLMELFETKTNTLTGMEEVSKTKMFDKYDRKIFMMYFGIDYKRDRNDENKIKTKDVYSQEEMRFEIEAMFRADGQVGRDGKPKTMSQPGLSYRINKILENIDRAMKFNPTLKTGFEYLYNYWLANQGALSDMSNYREEIGISIDRTELKEIYADDSQQLNRQLTDGKRLSDTFEITETNPLDDEIAGLFNDYL